MKIWPAILLIALTAFSAGDLAASRPDFRLALRDLPPSYTLSVRTESDSSALAIVQDGYGRPVKGLDAGSFTVTGSDGRRGRIVRVVPLDETPVVDLRVVLVIDNSKSMLPKLDKVLADMDSLLAQLNDEAEISVVSFSTQQMILGNQRLNVRTTPFIRNKDKIRQIYTDIMRNKMTHSTYLYDAVYAASTVLQERPTMVRGREIRTFVILFSDGRDIGSEVTAQMALGQVYTGGSTAPVFFTVDYFRKSNAFLKSLAAKTGGVYYAARQDGRLDDILTTVARDTYSSGYRVVFDWRFPPAILISNAPSSISMYGTTVNEAFPLLSYIFFDEQSGELPSRYVVLSPQEADSFTVDSLPPDAMTYYYNLLNIIGSRLRAHPQATVTITGCNADIGGEKNNLALSEARAAAVADYLRTVWRIDPARIAVETRNLPAAPSRNTDEAAGSENRRVEISSTTWDIVRPVIFRNTVYRVGSDSVSTVGARVEADGGVRECAWYLYHGDNILWRAGALPDLTAPVLTVNWQDILSNYAPYANDSLRLVLRAVSRSGDTASEQVFIATRIVPEPHTTRSERDKISLILFDFSKADISGYNHRIMKEFVFPHLGTASTVVVRGHTDNVGNPELNINLAEKRAQAVGAIIRSAVPVGNLRMHGVGETAPLFSNTLPEGRLYNRTVVIYIDTPTSAE